MATEYMIHDIQSRIGYEINIVPKNATYLICFVIIFRGVKYLDYTLFGINQPSQKS